uniref:Uncharacterized protein n=1 Tax=Parascaris univalens TaxID=6257 RepID=A0A914ZGZ6_PARUN
YQFNSFIALTASTISVKRDQHFTLCHHTLSSHSNIQPKPECKREILCTNPTLVNCLISRQIIKSNYSKRLLLCDEKNTEDHHFRILRNEVINLTNIRVKSFPIKF